MRNPASFAAAATYRSPLSRKSPGQAVDRPTMVAESSRIATSPELLVELSMKRYRTLGGGVAAAKRKNGDSLKLFVARMVKSGATKTSLFWSNTTKAAPFQTTASSR